MSRTRLAFLNIQVNLFFHVAGLVVAFFYRKIFLELLGSDFLGLALTIGNILAIVAIVEFGLFTTVSVQLYNPLSNQDKPKITDLILVFRRLYHKVGWIFLGLGTLIVLTAPLIFGNSKLNDSTILLSFVTYILISSFDYFFNYKQVVLFADQKRYLATIYLSSINLLKILVQVSLLKIGFTQIWIYLACELLFAIIKSIALRQLIRKNYPWLDTNHQSKVQSQEILSTIKKKSKQIFVHKLATLILTKTDVILIFWLTNLKMVTYYGNYLLIIQQLIQLSVLPFGTISSSIGNLISTKNDKVIQKAFTEFIILKYWLGGIFLCCAYLLINPFIALWLGSYYIIEKPIVTLALINAFIMITRQPVDLFLQGYGLFHDTWAAITEAVLNLASSIILGYYFGIIGVLAGNSISLLLMVCLWKPYLLFKEGFHQSLIPYFIRIAGYITLFLIAALTTRFIYHQIKIDQDQLIIKFIFEVLLVSGSFTIIYTILLFIFFREMRHLTKRFTSLRIQTN